MTTDDLPSQYPTETIIVYVLYYMVNKLEKHPEWVATYTLLLECLFEMQKQTPIRLQM